MKPNTKLVFSETPANPLMTLVDLEEISKFAKECGAYHVCDSTFATPVICKPLDHGCFMVMQTTKTMALRVKQQSETAMAIAKFLETHPKVTKVVYPGLASHPQKDVADKYHRNGLHGGMLWFDIVGGSPAGTKLMN